METITRVTVAKAADIIGVSIDTIYALIQSGQLAAIDASVNPKSKRPSYRIELQEIDAFASRRRAGPILKVRSQPATRRYVRPAGMPKLIG